jgi:hypothetical protein
VTRGAVRFLRRRLGARDDLYAAVGLRVERADSMFFDEGEDVLVVRGREDDRAAEHEAFAYLLLG